MISVSAQRTLLVSARHRPRTLHRVVTTVAGRGFDIEDLHYARSADGESALATIVLGPPVDAGRLEHLAKVLAKAIEVYWAEPLPRIVTAERAEGPLRLERYEVSTRAGRGGSGRTEAVLAASLEGSRHLAAGDGHDAITALIAAFRTLLEPIIGSGASTLEVTDRWSGADRTDLAFARAALAGPIVRHERLRVARDETGAAVAALAGVASAAVAEAASAARAG